MDSTLSVQQAAAHFGVSEKTIRRRIAAGEISAFKVPTAQGYEWRIQLDTDAVQVPGDAVQLDAQSVQEPGQPTMHLDTEQGAGLLKALDLADSLRQENAQLRTENVQLAGQVGYLQRHVLELQEQVRLLTMDKEPAEEPPAPQPTPEPAPHSEARSPLWQWVRRRLSRT